MTESVTVLEQGAAVFDLYEIVGSAGGFYVGQAQHNEAGGWWRRVKAHRCGRGSKGALRLLSTGGSARLVGAVMCTPEFALVLEARLWDARYRRGQVPVHERPWGAGMPEQQARRASSITGTRRSKRRDAVWERAGGRCEGCGRTVVRAEWEAHVHHTIYRGRGRERMEDLELLCLACHGAVHPHRVMCTRQEQEARRAANAARRNTTRRG